MKKNFVFASVFGLLLLASCGDSGSDNAASPEAQAYSSENVSSATDAALSSAEGTSSSSGAELSSGTEMVTLSSSSAEEVSTDPYAIGTDVDEPSYEPSDCVVTPMGSGKGDSIVCAGVYAGPIYYDTDSSAYDPLNPDLSIFTSINKVFDALQADERVVFVLRHAERNSSSGTLSHLTETGVYSAQSVGKKIASEEPAYYAHSEYVRTRETLENIAKGRGETGFTHDAYGVLNGSWFVKNSEAYSAYASQTTDGNYTSITDWAYNGGYEDAFYDLDTRAKQFVDEFLVDIISKKARISVVCSHDQFLVPLTVYASNRQINLKYFEDRNWITYLAGIAVIIKSDGSVTTLPVKGLDSGI